MASDQDKDSNQSEDQLDQFDQLDLIDQEYIAILLQRNYRCKLKGPGPC